MRKARLLATALIPLLLQSAGMAGQGPTSDAAKREFLQRLVVAARERTHHTVQYDPAYIRVAYPGGDVPADRGVCTDELIRS
jgi:uncharacterized protein YijF (DUF1287 family)